MRYPKKIWSLHWTDKLSDQIKKYFSLLLLVIIFPFNALSQSAPGNIGNSNGSNGQPELKLWLISDSLSLSSGDDVLDWTDYSGNSNNFSAVSSTSPIFRAALINGHDYLEFSKSNNRIVNYPFDIPSDAVTVFIVLRTSDSGDGLISYATSSNDNEYLFFQSDNLNTYINQSSLNHGISYNDGDWKIFSHQWRNSDGRLYVHINGNELANTTHQIGVSLGSGGALSIGGEQDGLNSGYAAGQDFDGDIAEFIMYGSSLNQAQRVIVENYLAQKYGLDANLPLDLFTPPSALYISDLSGMGKETDGEAELRSGGLVVSGINNYDNGEYIFAAHNGTVNSINSLPNVIYSDIESAWERNWYLEKTGSFDARIAFDLSEGINGKYPSNIENYRLLYKANPIDSYDTISVLQKGVQNGDQIFFDVVDADISNGYYTIGTIDEIASPLNGVEGRTWYALINGDWDNWEVWTLDPSGMLPDNPGNYTPTTSPTSNADNVVVRSGKTITVSSDNKSNASLRVDGRLDLTTTSNHSFGEIEGSGRILIEGDNFPSGDASHFSSAGLGEGTVVYYGGNYNLTNSKEFYNVEVNLANPVNTITLLADYTINGNLRIENGILQINDNISTSALNILVGENIEVMNNGQITTGQGNAYHQLTLNGDLRNEGRIEFTNRSAADYTNMANDGVVELIADNDSRDQEIQCLGVTNFYRIEINKGLDKTYILNIKASQSSYFNLFGYANEAHNNVPQLSTNSNALGLIRGTVKIGPNVNIPVLNNSGNYNISESARLWVDGGYVAKNNGVAIVPYGDLQVSSGSVEALISSGITTRANGSIIIEGGTLSTNQIRTSVLGADNVGGYVQSGGITHILGSNTNTDYYCFNLTYPGNVFNMTGGTLHIHEAHGKGGIFIASDQSNINVAGGTVIMEIDDNNDFPVTSTAQFWNLIIRNTSGGNGSHILTEGVDVGATNEYLAAQPLVVLNDLTIEADAFLNHNGNDLTIGRSFSIDANAQTRTFDDSGMNDTYNDYNIGYLYDPAIPNTTTFNGSEDGEFYIGYNNSDGFEEFFHNITINKAIGSSVTVVCDTEKTAQYQDDNNRNHWHARLLRVENELNVESGIFNQGESAFRLFGPLTVLENGECGVWEQGITHPWAWLMLKDAELEINTEDGAIIGNIKLNPNPQTDIITFTSDVYIKRIGYFHGRINMNSYNLKIDYLHDRLTTNNYDISDGNSNSEMFFSNGEPSGGGLSLYIPAGTTDGTVFPFPIGVTSKYTPAELTISNVTDDGYITILPADKELTTTELTGGDLLDYYWRIKHEGFSTLPTIDVVDFYYDDADIIGDENNYVAGKVLSENPFTRIYEDDQVPESEGVNPGANRIRFNGQTDAGFTLEYANYTAGVTGRFTGAVEVFYLRRNGNWHSGNTWSYTRGGSSAGDYPKAGDIAVIRRLNNSYSGIVTVLRAEQAAAVIFDDENGWSSGCPRIIFSRQSNFAAYNSGFDVVDVASTHEGGTLNYNTHGAVIQYNINEDYSKGTSSLSFDGTDDYVAIQNFNYNSSGNTELTVEAWVKTDDGNDQVIASFDRNEYWRLEINGSGAGYGQVGFDVMTDAGQMDFGSIRRVDDGEWHHIAAVYDNGNAYIYIDGILDNSTTSGSNFGTGTIRYGYLGVGSESGSFDADKGPTDYFNGSLSDVRIWSAARTQAEIQANMNDFLAGNEAGLEAYFRLEGTDTDNTAIDDGPNGYDGTLTNMILPGAWLNNHPLDGRFPNGDFGGFNKYPNALVIYSWDGASANEDITLSSSATEYPQMWFEGGNDSRIIRFPDADVTIHGTITVPQRTIVIANGESPNTITMEQSLNIGHNSLGPGGQFLFPGDATSYVTVDIKKNLRISGNAVSTLGIENPTGNNAIHRLIVGGDVNIRSTGGNIQLGDGDPAKSNVELEFQGKSDNTFSIDNASSSAQFYRLIMNKGTDTTYSMSMNSNFTLTGPTSGVGVKKAIELQNGRFILNNASINLDLNTGDDDFEIPGTAALELMQGQANVSGNNTGILLDGVLSITGGMLDMTTGPGNGNNYIEYSASSNALLEVTSGTLNVGSQIRRGLSSDLGILSYAQSGGTVNVGVNAAPEGNRGVFEIIGKGSSFTHSGGDFYIVRQQSSPVIATLHLEPSNYDISSGTTINLGNASTPANQNLGINSTIPLSNLVLNNSSNNNPEAKIWVSPLTISEDLTIEANTALDADGHDVTIQGNIINGGNYLPNNNTTYLSGSGDQEIRGNTDFYNLIKTTSNTLTLESNNAEISILNDLDIQAGTLDDGGNSIFVDGYCNMDAFHIHRNLGDGIVLQGSFQQQLTGNGTFGKLTINNANNILVPLGNEFTITDTLKMQDGVFYIGSNLLTLNANAAIDEASSFSETNMIQTNISFTDNGVRKIFPAGASNFTFPIGASGKYTPIFVNATDNGNSTGHLTVKAANEIHPSIVEDSESPDPDIVDSDNVLQYHWLINSVGISGLSATVDMKYIPADVRTTSPYDEYDYITARLLNDGTGNWNKYDDTASFDENNQLLHFTFTSAGDDEIGGDYTAGVDGSGFLGAIPDLVPFYESATNGDWETGTVWTPNISGGPRGSIVRINDNDTITLTDNYSSSYTIEINGVAKINNTFGHRFGIVSGDGLIYLQSEALPAGIYDDFFASTGGTLEFGGTNDYDVLAGITKLNNLSFSGDGEKRLPNQALLLRGDLEINGSSGLNVINEHNQTITLNGDITLNNGSFDAGYGTNAKIILNGSSIQNINGVFTGNNNFNILEINNSNGVHLNGNINVDQQLKLTNGVVSTNGNTLRIKNNGTISPTSGTLSSYVDGAITKELINGSNFTFPIADGTNRGTVEITNATGFSGVQDFIMQYYFDNPTDAGFDSEQYSSPLNMVSESEYWDVSGPSGAQVKLSFTLDGSSDIANSTELNSLRIVAWNGSQWVVVGGVPSISGNASSGKVTTSSYVSLDGTLQHFTLGSIQLLPKATATIVSSDETICDGSATDIEILLTGEQPWSITYEEDGTPQTVTGITINNYLLTVSPAANTSYVLTEVSDNNGLGTLTGNLDVTISVESVFAEVTSVDANCNGASNGTITIYNQSGGSGYYTYSINGGADWYPTYEFISLPSNNYDVRIRDANPPNCEFTINNSLLIDEPTEITASITSFDEQCNNNNDGEINIISASGGSGSFEYSITDGAIWLASNIFSNLAPDTYEVWIRDQNENTCTVYLGSVTINPGIEIDTLEIYRNPNE